MVERIILNNGEISKVTQAYVIYIPLMCFLEVTIM